MDETTKKKICALLSTAFQEKKSVQTQRKKKYMKKMKVNSEAPLENCTTTSNRIDLNKFALLFFIMCSIPLSGNAMNECGEKRSIEI